MQQWKMPVSTQLRDASHCRRANTEANLERGEVSVTRRGLLGFRHDLRRGWLTLGLVLASCTPPKPAGGEEQMAAAGVTPALVDLSRLSLQPGESEQGLSVAGQSQRLMALWMPENTTPRTLVILLHGRVTDHHGVVGPAARKQTSALVECLAAPALASLDPIIIAPYSETGQWWLKEDTELVLGLAEAVQKRWPMTRGRSVIAGYSNGGIGTWFFARLYASFFSAAIPMAFNDTIVGASPLPVYAIQGSADEQFDIQRVRAAVEALKAQGQDVTFNEKYRGSHLKACSYAPELREASRWLEAHAFPGARAGVTPAQPPEGKTP